MEALEPIRLRRPVDMGGGWLGTQRSAIRTGRVVSFSGMGAGDAAPNRTPLDL
jgi:hypothetical protein